MSVVEWAVPVDMTKGEVVVAAQNEGREEVAREGETGVMRVIVTATHCTAFTYVSLYIIVSDASSYRRDRERERRREEKAALKRKHRAARKEREKKEKRKLEARLRLGLSAIEAEEEDWMAKERKANDIWVRPDKYALFYDTLQVRFFLALTTVPERARTILTKLEIKPIFDTADYTLRIYHAFIETTRLAMILLIRGYCLIFSVLELQNSILFATTKIESPTLSAPLTK